MSTKTSHPERSTPGTASASSDNLCMNMPSPAPEHGFLRRFEGDWETESEIFMAPDQPPMKAKGTDRGRMIGGFWLAAEVRHDDGSFEARLTLGYDPKTKKYIGAWVDSMSSHLWRYEGSADASGRILTLETEGPMPPDLTKHSKFREVTEFKSDDHRVFTSSRLEPDGKLTKIITIHSRRKK